MTAMAAALDRDADELSAQLVAALAALAQMMGRELAEADWWRLLDALLLIAAHPSASLAADPAATSCVATWDVVERVYGT